MSTIKNIHSLPSPSKYERIRRLVKGSERNYCTGQCLQTLFHEPVIYRLYNCSFKYCQAPFYAHTLFAQVKSSFDLYFCYSKTQAKALRKLSKFTSLRHILSARRWIFPHDVKACELIKFKFKFKMSHFVKDSLLGNHNVWDSTLGQSEFNDVPSLDRHIVLVKKLIVSNQCFFWKNVSALVTLRCDAKESCGCHFALLLITSHGPHSSDATPAARRISRIAALNRLAIGIRNHSHNVLASWNMEVIF